MARVTERLVGGFTDGRPVYEYTLTTAEGQRAVVSNLGAALTHWARTDAHGTHPRRRRTSRTC
jgi:galactose mutarotase-like enzyme